MADIAKLKPKGAGKGTPPAPAETNNNLKTPPREITVKRAPQQFSLPADMIEEFSQEAGKRFGFKKGSKSDLFMAMWEEYKEKHKI